MNTTYQSRKRILDWVNYMTTHPNDLADIEGLDESIIERLKSDETENKVSFDPETDIVTITDFELVHTSSADRCRIIENLDAGVSLNVKWEDYDIYVTTMDGMTIGELPAFNYGITDILRAGDASVLSVTTTKVIPKSQRDSKHKKAIVKVEIVIQLKPVDRTETECIFMLTAGDHSDAWHQKIDVIYSAMPIDDAKLLLEIRNRQINEYDESNNSTDHIGLDGMADEVAKAREMMRSQKQPEINYDYIGNDNEWGFAPSFKRAVKENPERYGNLLKYIDVHNLDYSDFDDFLESSILDKETHYWIEQERCSKEEYEKLNGYYGYRVIELFEGRICPIDFDDPDVVSSFGTDKFVSLADLSRTYTLGDKYE